MAWVSHTKPINQRNSILSQRGRYYIISPYWTGIARCSIPTRSICHIRGVLSDKQKTFKMGLEFVWVCKKWIPWMAYVLRPKSSTNGNGIRVIWTGYRTSLSPESRPYNLQKILNLWNVEKPLLNYRVGLQRPLGLSVQHYHTRPWPLTTSKRSCYVLNRTRTILQQSLYLLTGTSKDDSGPLTSSFLRIILLMPWTGMVMLNG